MIFSTLSRLLVVNLKAENIYPQQPDKESPRGPSSTSGPLAPTILLGTFDHSASGRLFSESPKGIVPPPIERRGGISCSVYLCTCLLVLLFFFLLWQNILFKDNLSFHSQDLIKMIGAGSGAIVWCNWCKISGAGEIRVHSPAQRLLCLLLSRSNQTQPKYFQFM